MFEYDRFPGPAAGRAWLVVERGLSVRIEPGVGGRFIEVYAANLFNEHWGEQARAADDNALHVEFLGEVKVKELGDRVCWKLRNRSGRYPTTAAPTMAPAMLPEPPRTTAATNRIENSKTKLSGLMETTLEAGGRARCSRGNKARGHSGARGPKVRRGPPAANFW